MALVDVSSISREKGEIKEILQAPKESDFFTQYSEKGEAIWQGKIRAVKPTFLVALHNVEFSQVLD